MKLRDIINRVKHPKVELIFKIVCAKRMDQTRDYHLEVRVKNNGTVLANYINCFIKLPKKTLLEYYDSIGTFSDKIEFIGDNTIRDLIESKSNSVFKSTAIYGPSRYIPLLPRNHIKVNINIPLLHPFYREDNSELEWIAFADSAEASSGIIKFEDIQYMEVYYKEWRH